MYNKKEIKELVHKNSSLRLDGELDEHYKDSTVLDFQTRENGSVGEEEYGEEDYNDAVKVKNLLLAKFKNISVGIDTCDEWVFLNISLL